MERRKFLHRSFLVTGGVLLAGPSLAQVPKRKTKKITILHTNDTHSNIDPFPANHAKFPNQGGVAKRFEYIKQIRAQEKNVLLLDAGDIFQGTPYFNKFGGVLEMKLMTELGYDAATMGNHDFDGGMDGFLKAIEHAKFPFLCANYDFSATILNGKTRTHTIIEKEGVKIGIFGVGIELKGLVPDAKCLGAVYTDPIAAANREALFLKEQGCQLIICLSHLGFDYPTDKISDKVLAQQTRNIHLILGGHTHTFLEQPCEMKNADNATVLINQVGWGGLQLGRLDIELETTTFAKKSVIVVK